MGEVIELKSKQSDGLGITDEMIEYMNEWGPEEYNNFRNCLLEKYDMERGSIGIFHVMHGALHDLIMMGWTEEDLKNEVDIAIELFREHHE